MKLIPFLALSAVAASPTFAEDTRQLDAHEHGLGELNIAFDGSQIGIELHAPGADIVGFEYVAETAADRDAIDAAVATLARPLDLFVIPDAAGCSVVQAAAELESEDDHDDHDDEDHSDHADDHDDHDDHASKAGHTEFHVEYLLTCADPTAVTNITFAYFETFKNALEVDVNVITDTGATSFEVTRDAPSLDLRGMF